MAEGPEYIGITETPAALVQSVEIERKPGNDIVRKNSTGGFAVAHTSDPMHVFNVTTLGTTDEEVGSPLAMSLSTITGGKNLVLEKTVKKVNDNFNESTFSGEHYPSATVGA